MRVIVTRHAMQRYLERVGRIERDALAERIRRRLMWKLRTKAVFDGRGAMHLHLKGGFRAVVRPSRVGWLVITVYKPGEKEAAG